MGCSHDNRIFLVTYKSQIIQGILSKESPKLLCLNCKNDPDFVNDSIVDSIYDIGTGVLIK
jgi:hypothetical protein